MKVKYTVAKVDIQTPSLYEKEKDFKNAKEMFKFLRDPESSEFFYGRGFHILKNDEVIADDDDYNAMNIKEDSFGKLLRRHDSISALLEAREEYKA